MNPDSPHDPPHEFLILQAPLTVPTRRTPWLRPVAQLLKTPLLYGDQLVASTATATGRPVRALVRAVHPLSSVQPEILKAPVLVVQLPLTALYGQADSVVIPWSLTYLKALSIRPPLQAWLPYEPEQSTNCCQEKLWRVPQPILLSPSRAPVEEKAQHEPQLPWFLTPVTAPAATQSTSVGMQCSSTTFSTLPTLVPRKVLTNSSWVRWVNWLMPISQVWSFLAL